MRFGFITSVRLGESCIEELLKLGANLVYLGTLNDEIAPAKSGRIFLDELASQHDIPLHKFRNMNDADALDGMRRADLDWLFVIGWSQMAGPEVLSLPQEGVVGIHPTLLPEGRGRASIPWAIIKGLGETGVSMFQLDEGMDTGPLLGQIKVPIASNETSTSLYEKVVLAHRELIRDSYPALESGTIERVEQDHSQATIWPGRRPSDGELDLEALDAVMVDRMVRALTHPYPGAFIHDERGDVVRIWCGQLKNPGDDALPIQTRSGYYYATRYDRDV